MNIFFILRGYTLTKIYNLNLYFTAVVPHESGDWIILDSYDMPMIKDIRSFGNKLTFPIASALRKRVESTIYQITNVFIDTSRKSPLNESDWSAHFDDEGRLVNPQELWVIVFNWGVEPNLRQRVWKHLLNVFPPDLTEIEREKYLAMKSKVYWQIRTRKISYRRANLSGIWYGKT